MLGGSGVVEHNPYSPSWMLGVLDELTIWGLRPFKVGLDVFLAAFFPTMEERLRPLRLLPVCLLYVPLSVAFMLLVLPLTVAAFLLWLAIQGSRKPYRLSVNAALPAAPLKQEYGFMSANLCLLPDSMSRINNLTRSWWRSQKLGQILAGEEGSHMTGKYANSVTRTPNGSVKGNGIFPNNNMYANMEHFSSEFRDVNAGNGAVLHRHGEPGANPDFDVSVLDDFPEVDFLMLQEASWDILYARRLKRELHKTYAHVIHDVAVHTLRGNMYVGNSGMMVASKYPIVDVRFGLYDTSCKQCKYASKGLLQMKVYLGTRDDAKRVVGYLFATHLQAYQETMPVQCRQMDDMVRWMREYRQTTWRPDEVVAFDVLGGDFNLDNMSPVDEESQNHALFRDYTDVSRVTGGKDQPWAVGTELRQIMMHDPEVSTPAGLKRALQDPILMQTYVLDADIVRASAAMSFALARRDEVGNVIPSPVGGRRRIDYVLYNSGGPTVKALAYNAVTSLADLTDHIPVYLQLRVDY